MKIESFNKTNWSLLALLLVMSVLLIYTNCKGQKGAVNPPNGKYEYVDSNKVTHKGYSDTDFKAIKAENKELYDSLKDCKDMIDYLMQFKYRKSYSTGVVYTHPESTEPVAKDDVAQDKEPYVTYEYSNNANDTIQYNLKVNSQREPNWYQLNVTVSDKFTIVNKNVNGQNELTLGSENKGDIQTTTVFHAKEKKSFWRRVAVGPTVTAGYDPLNNKMGVMVGVGVTLNVF